MNEFKFTQDYAVYRFKRQGVYPIQESDWNRLKRMIKAIIPHKRIFQILSSISFGIFASSMFALIAFQSATQLDSWVLPTTWSIFSVSLILGIGLLVLDYKQKEIIQVSTTNVIAEMDLLEQSYDRTAAESATNDNPTQ